MLQHHGKGGVKNPDPEDQDFNVGLNYSWQVTIEKGL